METDEAFAYPGVLVLDQTYLVIGSHAVAGAVDCDLTCAVTLAYVDVMSWLVTEALDRVGTAEVDLHVDLPTY